MYSFYITIQDMLSFIKKFPLTTKRKIAINVLERYLNLLCGKNPPQPTKEEIKTTIDVIKEMKQQNATIEEYEQLENFAKEAKYIIEWTYKK